MALALLLLIGQTAVARAQAENATPTLMRIAFGSPAQLDRLTATVDVWEVNHAGGYVIAPLLPAEERALAQVGYALTVDDLSAQRLRTAQSTFDAATAAGDGQQPARGISGFPCYRTVEETYADLAALAANHPDLAEWIDIGDSWLKQQNPTEGYDLRALALTNQASAAPKASFYLVAAVHARELTTAELATRFAEYLVAGYGKDPEVTWLLDHTTIHIVPLANPDGRKEAEKGILWRKNVATGDGCLVNNPPNTYAGVDLNRNGSFAWNGCGDGSCSSSQACAITYRGPAPGSEPETQTLEAYARSIFADQRAPELTAPASLDAMGLFISLHSYSNLVLFPWGWSEQLTPNAAQLRTLGRKFGYFNGYGVCQISQPGCLYRADGTNDDFMYGELGVAAYTFELGDFFFESCTAFEETIWPTNLPALLYAAKAARRPYRTPAGPEVTRLDVGPMPLEPGGPFTVTLTLDDSRYSSNGFGAEAVQAIAGGRYSLNEPAWLTTTTDFLPPMPEAGAVMSTTLTIATDGLAVGRHMLFVEGRDAAEQWGVPSAQFVDISKGERAVTALIPATAVGMAGSDTLLTLTITNTGQIVDDYAVQVTESPWPVALSSERVTLEPSAQAKVTLAVTTPPGTAQDLTETVRVGVASTMEPWVSVTTATAISVTAPAVEYQLFFPLAGR